MKKGIKAQLYLPKECLDILFNKKETVVNHFDNYFNDLTYDIFLGEYENKEVCCIEIILLNRTSSAVNTDYRDFKAYLKEMTGKQPKQILMFKFDRV